MHPFILLLIVFILYVDFYVCPLLTIATCFKQPLFWKTCHFLLALIVYNYKTSCKEQKSLVSQNRQVQFKSSQILWSLYFCKVFVVFSANQYFEWSFLVEIIFWHIRLKKCFWSMHRGATFSIIISFVATNVAVWSSNKCLF